MVVAIAAFVLAQGGGGEDSGPLNAIAEAAEKTQDQPGGRAALHSVVTSPDPSESFTMSGEMAFTKEPERTQAAITIAKPESDGSAEMRMVSDGTVMYMQSDLFGSLPDGSEWMALDVSLGELDSLGGNSDARGELELLEEATGEIEKLGKEEVRGVPTTRYRGTVGVSEQAENLREKGADGLATFIEEKSTPLQVEAWIDSKGLVRRMKFVKSEPRKDGDGSVTTAMRIDYYDFGVVPEIDVPDSDDVFDATELARDEVGISDDN